MNNDITVLPNYISDEKAESLIKLLNENDSDDDNWGSPCFPSFWRSIGGDPSLEPPNNPIPDLINQVTSSVVEHFSNNELVPFRVKGHKHPEGSFTEPRGYKDYAAVLFLNEDYEGGEFIMPSQDVSLKPGSCDLIVFEDAGRDKTRLYGVAQVAGGTRYSITFTFSIGSDDE